MILLCAVNIGGLDNSNIFIKNVPTKVLHITKDKTALVEFSFKQVKSITYYGPKKIKAMTTVKDLKGPDMRCKRK